VRAEESRTVRLAARAAHASESELQERLTRARTHIRVNATTAGAFACAEVLIATLRRGPGQLSIDPAELTAAQLARLQQISTALAPGKPLQANPAPPPHATQIAIGQTPADIVVVPDAHGARLARGDIPPQHRAPSMLGVVFAAALAAGEAFKDAAQISEEHCTRQRELAFCPVTLGPEPGAAPLIGVDWEPAVTLIGLGAIGTAHALILGGLTHHGGAVLIDRERFGPENLGTYSLGEHHDIAARTPKVTLAERALFGWRHHPHHGEISDAIRDLDTQRLPWTPIALAGLDNHQARRDAQRLQADRLLDAATGNTTVGLRDTRAAGPCLRCMLPTPTRPSPTDALTELGIPLELARAPGESVVDDALIAGAASEHARRLLTAARGTPICGLLRAAGLTGLDSGDYMPSVPFVSQQAACLAAGRLVAITAGIDAGLPNFFQYDTLMSPHAAIRQQRRADPDCACQQRAGTIAQVREERRGGPAA
jgi:hypothetical protein